MYAKRLLSKARRQFRMNRPVSLVLVRANGMWDPGWQWCAQESTMNIKSIKETSRSVGVGIIKVAKALWQVDVAADISAAGMGGGDESPRASSLAKPSSKRDVHFAQFLVHPLRQKMEQMMQSSNTENHIPTILTMVSMSATHPNYPDGERTSYHRRHPTRYFAAERIHISQLS